METVGCGDAGRGCWSVEPAAAHPAAAPLKRAFWRLCLDRTIQTYHPIPFPSLKIGLPYRPPKNKEHDQPSLQRIYKVQDRRRLHKLIFWRPIRTNEFRDSSRCLPSLALQPTKAAPQKPPKWPRCALRTSTLPTRRPPRPMPSPWRT